MKRVLVTGGSGFIGRQVFEPLAARGYEVHATTRGAHPASAAVVWHRCDLLDAGEADALLLRLQPTHLLHLAWYAEHGKFWASPHNLDWIAASVKLVRSFQAHGGRRAVIAGTCAEYRWGCGPCVEGQTPLEPATLYGVSKNALRQVVESFGATCGLSVAWGRIFLLYGPHEHPDRLVPSVIRALLRGQVAETSSGDLERDFLHAADVAAAFAALLDSAVEGAVNIGSGRATPLREVASTLASILQKKDLLRLGTRPARPNDPPSLVPDVRRLREEVGWTPRWGLRAGLEDAVEWWRSRMAAHPD